MYIKDINNFFSNVGYVVLGLSFISITWFKQNLYSKRSRIESKEFPMGVPQFFGIFYALGLSLILQGILSACFHVCPTNDSFQFDTTFTYVIALLLITKIYQFRHPDVTASAYKIFTGISFVLFLEVIGIKYPQNILFWVFLSLIYLYGIVSLAPILYESGQWKKIWQGRAVSLQVTNYQFLFILSFK